MMLGPHGIAYLSPQGLCLREDMGQGQPPMPPKIPVSPGTLTEQRCNAKQNAIRSMEGLKWTIQQFTGLLEQMKDWGRFNPPLTGPLHRCVDPSVALGRSADPSAALY